MTEDWCIDTLTSHFQTYDFIYLLFLILERFLGIIWFYICIYCKMNSINLVIIHHHTYYWQKKVFLVMTTYKMYSLRKFQVYNTILFIIVIMLYIISPCLIYLVTGRSHLQNPFTHFAHPLSPPSSVHLGQPLIWFFISMSWWFFF